MSESGRVPRTRCLSTVAQCCTRDEGRLLGAGSQVQASNHCKLLSLRAMVVSVMRLLLLNVVESRPERRAGPEADILCYLGRRSMARQTSA